MSTPIFTVSQLNRQVRSWLEHEMGTVHVQGELSNVTQPASGHLYFTLKDTSAQIRCVYFRNRHRVSTSPQNGQQVILHGTLSLYEARGDYQLIVEQLEDAGRGDLFRQFECLKAKLAACGWFDASRKKALPLFPEVIGVITSATGAAWRDVMTTLARRYPVAKIILYASDVQGSLAAPQLIQAIAEANRDSRSDVLILARGGGSIEDLWAFNDERLAAEMINSKIPIISGVGHETDFTIADFVADHRAATPTAAAVAATPDREEIFNTLRSLENQLLSFMNRFVQHLKLLLQHELQKITSPKQLINAQWQSLDYCRGHLQHALEQLLAKKRHMLQEARAQLETQNPLKLLADGTSRLRALEASLYLHTMSQINQQSQQLNTLLATLHAVSPLATLERGYAIVTCRNKVLYNSLEVKPGDILDVRLAKGGLKANILGITLLSHESSKLC